MAAAYKDVVKKIKAAKTQKEIKKWQDFCDKLGDDRGLFITRDVHGNMDKFVMRALGVEDEDAYHKRVKAMHTKIQKLHGKEEPKAVPEDDS
jgi:hypothetical protein